MRANRRRRRRDLQRCPDRRGARGARPHLDALSGAGPIESLVIQTVTLPTQVTVVPAACTTPCASPTGSPSPPHGQHLAVDGRAARLHRSGRPAAGRGVELPVRGRPRRGADLARWRVWTAGSPRSTANQNAPLTFFTPGGPGAAGLRPRLRRSTTARSVIRRSTRRAAGPAPPPTGPPWCRARAPLAERQSRDRRPDHDRRNRLHRSGR